jgi:ornithine cyclodeaminase/alanine dehydrogenase-like protein (mu-crystallin family)
MLVLDEAQVSRLLDMDDAIAAVDAALRAQAAGKTHFPLRMAARAPGGILGAMPGIIAGDRPALGAKLVTFFLGNAELGIHTHNALIALFDPLTGEPRALMDGRYITEIRTAAASAVATRTLAISGASTLAILGTGVQARSHIDALSRVMKIADLRLCGRTKDKAEVLARWAREERKLPARAADSPESACRGAHVICTVTAATQPLFKAEAIGAGAHVNAVGASTPGMRELPTGLMSRARIFVDSREGAMQEAADIIQAIAEGALPKEPELTLLADAVAGEAPGRTSDEQITLFKSLGIAIEDIACAALVYERAKKVKPD